MTAPAGGWNISVTDARFGITARQQVVRAAVAIDAGRGLAVARPDGLGVIAALVGGLLVGMALGASNPARPDFMGRSFDVGMAVDAGKHAAVDRVLESVRVYEEADLLAVYVGRHGGITMAHQAIFVAGLGRWFAGEGDWRAAN